MQDLPSGVTLRQSPTSGATTEPRASGSTTASTTPRVLLTMADMRALLGGVGERRFHELRAAGVIPAPLELGPRTPRWTLEDAQAVVDRLQRRTRTEEPPTLAQGRRARIEAMKKAGCA